MPFLRQNDFEVTCVKVWLANTQRVPLPPLFLFGVGGAKRERAVYFEASWVKERMGKRGAELN